MISVNNWATKEEAEEMLALPNVQAFTPDVSYLIVQNGDATWSIEATYQNGTVGRIAIVQK